MGAYVNRQGKVKWLIENSVDSYNTNDFPEYSKIHEDDETFPVVLFHNGYFTAAGIAYSEEEYKELIKPSDPRQRMLFIVPTDKLKECSNLESYLKEVCY